MQRRTGSAAAHVRLTLITYQAKERESPMAKILYTANAHVTGGRQNGHGRTADGELEVGLRVAKELGGRRNEPGGTVRGRLRLLLRKRPRRRRPTAPARGR